MNNSMVFHHVALLTATTWSSFAAFGGFRRRASSGRAFLGIMMLVAALWAAAELLATAAPLFFSVPWLMAVRYVSMTALPAAWYALVSSFVSEHRSPSSRALTRLGLVPFMTAILAGTNSLHGLLWQPAADGSIAALGGWLWVQMAYGWTLLLVGWLELVHKASQEPSLWRGRWGILMGAGVVVALNATLRFFCFEGWGSPIMHLLLAGYGALLLGCFRAHNVSPLLLWAQRAFKAYPHEAVLALDSDDRVLDANAPALLLLAEHGVWWAVGRRAKDVLAGPLAPLADAETDDTVTLDAVGGGRHAIQPRVLPLGPAFGPWRARALVLRRVA